MGDVDDSLAAMDEPERGCLQRVIAAARRLVPEAEQGRSYGMPALKVDGKPLIGVLAAAKHLSIFPFSPRVVDALAPKLAGFPLSKGLSGSRRTIPSPRKWWRRWSGCGWRRSGSSA